jgi:hypothetical protein
LHSLVFSMSSDYRILQRAIELIRQTGGHRRQRQATLR